MAAEIRPGLKLTTTTMNRPTLIGKIEGFTEDLNDAQLIPGEDGVITAGDDKTIQIWLKRDSGQYWPSVCQYVPSQATVLHIQTEPTTNSSTTTIIYVGLENGTISTYQLAPDCNKLTHMKDYLSHIARVTAIECNSSDLFSVSRDKTFQWVDIINGEIQANYTGFNGWCTCLQFDTSTAHAFIGDYSGQITMLKITRPKLITLVTTFKGHSGSIRCLLWEASLNWLFSGSFDQNVCVWDIGGKKGTVFELQGHKGKVTGLAYKNQQLITSGEDSILVIWRMDCERKETPTWLESDTCQLCTKPFFWNLKSMFDNKVFGQRQHHCRACGRAVCDKCSSKKSVLAKFGFEFGVRICDGCHGNVKDEDKQSLATFHEAKHAVVNLRLDFKRDLLVTVGSDRVIKIWDVKEVVGGSAAMAAAATMAATPSAGASS